MNQLVAKKLFDDMTIYVLEHFDNVSMHIPKLFIAFLAISFILTMKNPVTGRHGLFRKIPTKFFDDDSDADSVDDFAVRKFSPKELHEFMSENENKLCEVVPENMLLSVRLSLSNTKSMRKHFHRIDPSEKKSVKFNNVMIAVGRKLLEKFNTEYVFVHSNELIMSFDANAYVNRNYVHLVSQFASYASVQFAHIARETCSLTVEPTFVPNMLETDKEEHLCSHVLWRMNSRKKNLLEEIASSNPSARQLLNHDFDNVGWEHVCEKLAGTNVGNENIFYGVVHHKDQGTSVVKSSATN